MPIDPAMAGLLANGVTRILETKIGERVCHHIGNGTIKDEVSYRKHKLSANEKRNSSGSSSSDSDRRRSSDDRRHSADDRGYPTDDGRYSMDDRRRSSHHDHRAESHHDAPKRPSADVRRRSSAYYNPEQRGTRRTGSRRKHRRPRRISDADLDVMAEEEEARRVSLAAHEERMDRFREAKKSYEPTP